MKSSPEDYFKMRSLGKFKSLKFFEPLTEEMCIDAIKHNIKSFKFVKNRTDRILKLLLDMKPTEIKDFSIEEQTNEICIHAIRSFRGKKGPKVDCLKFWSSIKNKSDAVCLEYAKFYNKLPGDFFSGKNEQFAYDLVMINYTFFKFVPIELQSDRIIKFCLLMEPKFFFSLLFRRDWMVIVFLLSHHNPLFALLERNKKLTFSMIPYVHHYENILKHKLKGMNIIEHIDLILSMSILNILKSKFLFYETCNQIMLKYTFLKCVLIDGYYVMKFKFLTYKDGEMIENYV